MATISKTPSATWKAVIRKSGWPTNIKTFRTKRDAEDWARRTEDEMVRGVYIDRAGSDRILLKHGLDRYLREVSSTKKTSTHSAEKHKAKALKASLGDYSLAAITPDLVARYRDERLEAGKSPSTVRLELSLLSHLFTVAIKEWRVGLSVCFTGCKALMPQRGDSHREGWRGYSPNTYSGHLNRPAPYR